MEFFVLVWRYAKAAEVFENYKQWYPSGPNIKFIPVPLAECYQKLGRKQEAIAATFDIDTVSADSSGTTVEVACGGQTPPISVDIVVFEGLIVTPDPGHVGVNETLVYKAMYDDSSGVAQDVSTSSDTKFSVTSGGGDFTSAGTVNTLTAGSTAGDYTVTGEYDEDSDGTYDVDGAATVYTETTDYDELSVTTPTADVVSYGTTGTYTATVRCVLLDAATSAEITNSEATNDCWVDIVEIRAIQYDDDGTWTDVPDPFYVPVDETVSFQVDPCVASTIWSDEASGTDSTADVTFDTLSTSLTDYKLVTATLCGGTDVTANIVVVEPETLVLEDRESGGSACDQDDSTAPDTLYCSVADNGKADVDFWILAPDSGATYSWNIISSRNLDSSNSYTDMEEDIDPGEYTLIVTNPADEDYIREIDFTVFKVDITDSDDNEITTLTTVSVGEKIDLNTEITPSGLSTSNWQWTIDGTTVKDYTMDQASASKTDLSTSDLQNDTVGFYWVTGGNPVVVSVSCKVQNVDCSDDVEYDVQRPTMGSFNSTTDDVAVALSGTTYCLWTTDNFPTEQGFAVDISLTQPSGSYRGRYKLVQLCETTSSRTKDIDDSVEVLETTGYWFDDFGDPRGPIWSGVNITYDDSEWEDSPKRPCESGYKKVIADDSYKDYIMYEPLDASGSALADSIWVPIGKLEWGWSGTAESADGGSTWTLTDGDFDDDDPSGSTTDEFPEWNDYLNYPTNPDWVAE